MTATHDFKCAHCGTERRAQTRALRHDFSECGSRTSKTGWHKWVKVTFSKGA